ncbi:carbohydrate ABC transporter permease [Paenibacillus silvisoli]|uniref:carbohydrate ABC transporter permease n=1 Tax=Paenibacillus silvisoli TaxID=3110539 RepID=UPI002804B6F5|nr:carbohydrate ABC transporter permease [Paenibacillus silvisoli]
MGKKWSVNETFKHSFIILVCIAMLYPLLLMVQMSVKDKKQIVFHFFSFNGPYHFVNYGKAWEKVAPMIWNSFVMSTGSALVGVLFAALAGYAFGKMKFPGRQILFWVLFAKMLLPGVMNFIPSFILALKLGLLDTYWVIILFAAAAAQPFWVFVIRTFVEQQPKELFESATIDGATELQTFWHVAAPLLKPMFTLMGINLFLGVWNDYIWPLVTIQSAEMRPLTIGLAFLTNGFPGDYGALMAGYVIASIPLLLLFVFGMRQFVAGLTGGAIKL